MDIITKKKRKRFDYFLQFSLKQFSLRFSQHCFLNLKNFQEFIQIIIFDDTDFNLYNCIDVYLLIKQQTISTSIKNNFFFFLFNFAFRGNYLCGNFKCNRF